MRITFFLAHANLSGGVRVVCAYARELRARGHQVTIISTPRKPVAIRGRIASFARGRGWPARGVGEPSHLAGASVKHIVVDPWRGLDPRHVPDADAIIATWWETAAWVRDLPASKGAKLYFMQDYGAPGQPLDRVIETWAYGLTIFTISHYLDELIQAHAPQPVTVIPNAVDTNIFNAHERAKNTHSTVGFLCSGNPEKGSRACIDAIQIAARTIPDIRALTFGPHAPDFPIPRDVDARWDVPERDLPAIYSACDAWLFATRREGFGLPILEAMACRTPVIATPAGAAPELLAGGGGILIEPDNPHAMAEAIIRVARMSTHEWRAMSDAGYRTARAWTWHDAAARLEALLEQTIQRADAPPARRQIAPSRGGMSAA